MIYLDNSATSYPKPLIVYETIKNTMKYYFSNPGRGGYPASVVTAEKVFEVREKTATFFGCERVENVAFMHNCTTAVNTVVKGILKQGDHVLISDLEHNSVLRPIEQLRRESIIKYDIFETDFYDSEKTLNAIKNKLQPNTRLLFCTHASNVLGVTLPLQKIGNLCRKEGVLFAVDAAQSAGILPIHMKSCGIDFLCVAAHKGLFAPMGIGVLLCGEQLPEPLVTGGTGSNSLNAYQPPFMPDRLEAGTADISSIIALGAGVDFIQKTSIDTIHKRETSHLLHIYHELKDLPEIECYADYNRLCAFSPVFSFNIKKTQSEAVAQYLSDHAIAVRAGLHCAPLTHRKIGTLDRGTVRISPSFFTTDCQINYTISTIKNAIKNFENY